MTVYVGPTNWWWISSPTASINCKVKATLNACGVGGALTDGSRIMCASSGLAIIVAPSTTQVTGQWAGGQYNSTSVGNKCCVSEWSALQSCLIARGFNPGDWFVPDVTQLLLGYTCRTRWDSFTASAQYWTSSEFNSTNGCLVLFGSGTTGNNAKSNTSFPVRAFRCVTY